MTAVDFPPSSRGDSRVANIAEIISHLIPPAGSIVVAGRGALAVAARIAARPDRFVQGIDTDPYSPTGLHILRALRGREFARSVPCHGVVLIDALDHMPIPEWFLSSLRAVSRYDAVLVVVSAAAIGGRARLDAQLDDSGWDLTSIKVAGANDRWIAPWPSPESRPVMVDGAVAELTPQEVEELGASVMVATARPHPDLVRDATLCSVVVDATAGRHDLVQNLCAQINEDSDFEVIVPTRSPLIGDDFDAFPGRARIVWPSTELDSVEARNAGMRSARGAYVAFVTTEQTDIDGSEVVNTIRSMIAHARNGGFAIVGSIPIDFIATTTSGTSVPWRIPAPQVRGSSASLAVDGPIVVCERQSLVRAGGLDPRLAGLAVVDLCLRLRSEGAALALFGQPTDEPACISGTGRERVALLERWSGHLAPSRVVAAVPRPKDRLVSRSAVPVVFTARVFDRGGIAAEARQLALALDQTGVDVRVDPTHWGPGLAARGRDLPARLDEIVVTEVPDRFVHVLHGDVTIEPVLPAGPGESPRPRWIRDPRATHVIARAMFDTDVVPPTWLAFLEEMDDVWVPTTLDAQRLRDAGFAEDRVHVVPGCIDARRYREAVRPLRIPGAMGFVFLAVAYADHRKGLDVLLRAYLDEFAADDDVTLVVKLSPSMDRPVAADVRALESFIAGHLGVGSHVGPRVVLMTDNLTDDEMLRLYHAADAYVLPTRGEGWGRPFMEAMACGIPTIATGWGAQCEFMNDANSFLVDYELVDISTTPRLRRAEPSLPHLRSVMRTVFGDAPSARIRAARGRTDVLERFDVSIAAKVMIRRLRALGARPARRVSPPAVQWEGPQLETFGMAVVNRELTRALRARGVSIDVAGDAEADLLEGLVTQPVTVRSAWPPNLEPVDAGRLVLAQPWEYGSVPRAWIHALGDTVDEIWAPTRFVRDCYLRSGADPARVHVVPLGVDPDRFHPEVQPVELATRKSFRFLFVGGTINRKGTDILVEAYLSAFGPGDDVCLVIRDLGSRTFYAGQGLGPELRALAADPNNAEILLLDDDIPDREMPGLYTACDALVHPYRGEGYGLPIVEAMACGLPVVVPRYGPVLDYCDDDTAILVTANERWETEAFVGGIETVGPGWSASVDRSAVAAAMRHLVEDRDDARAIGSRASQHVRRQHTWAQAASVALTRLSMPLPPTRRRSRSGPTISVCMVARDGGALIERALQSIDIVADEIVVVDTGSCDDTVEIARSFGATVHHRDWRDDFAWARNEAIEQAHGSWILMLDADMTLEPSSISELRCLAATELLWGFLVRQRNYTAVTGSAHLEHAAMRLFPRHPLLRFSGAVHEQLIATRPNVPFQIVPCGVVLHHEGFRPQFRDNRAVANRDSAILEAVIARDPTDAFATFNLAMSYRNLGRVADAIEQYRNCVALTAPRASGVFPQFAVSAYLALSELCLNEHRNAEAASYARDAVALAGRRADAMYLLGRALFASGDSSGAAEAYRSALGATPTYTVVPFESAAATWQPLCGLAEVAFAYGHRGDGEDLLRRAFASGDDPRIIAEAARVRSAAPRP